MGRAVLMLIGALVGASALGTWSCSETPLPATDAGGDDRVNTTNPDGSAPAPDAAARLLRHDGVTLPNMQLGVVYLGDVDAGGAPTADTLLSWLVGSPYWLLLDEYGVTNGKLVGSARVPLSSLLQSGDLDSNGMVDVAVLQERITTALHGDADAGTPSTISIPGAQAFVFYLPDGLDVILGHRGSYTYRTCVDANGYHAHDGFEPYVILPSCPEGRSLYAAAHELTEMATDPRPYDGWASDIDVAKNGGEVADLCAEKVMQEGVIVTRLWSNQAGGCVP